MPSTRRKSFRLGLALALGSAWAGSAHAQAVSDRFAIERFRIALDRDGILDVDAGTVPGHLSWNAGLWVGFAHDPLVVYDDQMEAVTSLVEQRLTTGLVGSLALWNRVELGLALDLVGHQDGTTASSTMPALSSAGLGDLRIAAKIALVSAGDFHLAVMPSVTVPTGGVGSYLRESATTFAPELAASWQRAQRHVALNAGYRIRERLTAPQLVIDDEVYLRLGASMALGPRTSPTIELAATLSAAIALADGAPPPALEAMAAAGRRLTPAMGVFVAAGVGLDNGVGTPDFRALAGLRVEGANGDPDGDSLFGVADQCAAEAEDRDGFEDDDGCPDLDNDRDRVADANDRCRDTPEDADGFEDTDGCAELDNDRDGIADGEDRCPLVAEDVDGFDDTDGCVDPSSPLAIEVVGTNGRKIEAATVTIRYAAQPTRPPIEATTGEDGRVEVAVHGGELEISATAPDYQLGTTVVQVAPPAAASASVQIVRKVRQGQLSGQVLSFDGKPVAAKVRVTSDGNPIEVATDAEGMYAVELPAGTFAVTIEADGYAVQKRTVSIKLDGVTVLNVDLRGRR